MRWQVAIRQSRAFSSRVAMIGRALLVGLLLLLGLQSPQVNAAARAFLDRDSIALGETVTLNVEVDGIGTGEPDLSALAGNFRVLGSSSNTQVSLVNGQQSARTLWGVVLEPLHEGVLGIPALSVRGETTAPMTLTVRSPAATSAAQGDVFIEVETSSTQPYVQQQIVYSIRLFYAVTLLDGQLDDPRIDAAEVRRIGSDATYQSERNGRRYNVIERRYAITPQRSGELTLPALRFRGRALSDAGRGRMFDPGRAVSAQADATTLQVRPAPSSAANPWLPAQALQYTAQLSAASSPAKVGEPITLTLRLQAQGLAAEQLPELVLPTIDGVDVYPDQESAQSLDGSGLIVGERVRRFAVVPKQAGPLAIPALQMHWWDVSKDAAATAEIPARQIAVVASDGSTSVPQDSTIPAAGALPGDSRASEEAPNRDDGPWPLLSALLAALWLATLAWVWRLRRRQMPPVAVSGDHTRPVDGRELQRALQGGDLPAIATALRAVAPTTQAQRRWSLQAVADSLQDAAQSAAVRKLERRLYAPRDAQEAIQAAELRNELRTAFRQSPRWQEDNAADAARGGLPPLYPPR